MCRGRQWSTRPCTLLRFSTLVRSSRGRGCALHGIRHHRAGAGGSDEVLDAAAAAADHVTAGGENGTAAGCEIACGIGGVEPLDEQVLGVGMGGGDRKSTRLNSSH